MIFMGIDWDWWAGAKCSCKKTKYRDPSPFDFARGQDDDVNKSKKATTTADFCGMTNKKSNDNAKSGEKFTFPLIAMRPR